MTTNHNDITFELFDKKTPKTIDNFHSLTHKNYYNNLSFHHIISNFMIQNGYPHGDNTNGPNYEFENKINQHKVVRNTLAMTNAKPNTNGSQFFIVTIGQTP